jgi:hypothetical protein
LINKTGKRGLAVVAMEISWRARKVICLQIPTVFLIGGRTTL